MKLNPQPAEPVSPGRILRRELEAHGWTQKDLAKIMGRPEQAISEIVSGEKRITYETAVQLEAALGASAAFWLSLEANYQLDKAKAATKTDVIERRRRLYEMLPIQEMIRREYVRPSTSVTTLEKDVCDFLGVADLEKSSTLAATFRGSEGKNVSQPACFAWLKRAEQLACTRGVRGFSTDRFEKKGVPALLDLTSNAEDVRKVPVLLAKYGVHFVLVPHFSKTYLDGAVFYLRRKPVIALSLRYDRMDSFWFTLMHEVAHLLNDRDQAFLDRTDTAAATREERRANRSAQDWLIPSVDFKRFLREPRRHFSRAEVVQFAGMVGRHPGIVVGRLHWERLVPHRNFRDTLAKVSPFLADLVDK